MLPPPLLRLGPAPVPLTVAAGARFPADQNHSDRSETVYAMPPPSSLAGSSSALAERPALAAPLHGAVGSQPVPFAIAPEPDPLADLVFAGSVTLNGEMMALLQDRRTGKGWYVIRGDYWGGLQVESVSADAVTFANAARRATLARDASFSAVPLSAYAAGFARSTPADEEQRTSGNFVNGILTNSVTLNDPAVALALDNRVESALSLGAEISLVETVHSVPEVQRPAAPVEVAGPIDEKF